MKKEDQYIEFREQLVKYLAGEMTFAERKAFEDMLSESEEKNALFAEYASIWEGVENLAARNRYDMDEEWNMLAGKIDFNEKKNKTISIRSYILRIAAVVLIGLSGLAGWYILRNNLSYKQVALEQGTETVHLADGSIVTMNAGSSLKYSIDAKEGKRNVILSGEAFFEVARDTTRPFIIEAGKAVIEVLGTSFNVNAFKNNPVVEVTVNSGIVSMAAKNIPDNLLILKPGNSGVLNNSEKRLKLISKADPNVFAWKTRDMVFSETPLSEVVRVINHVYKKNIQIGSDIISDCPITVSFSQQEFDAVLNIIVSTLDLKLERKEGAIILTGDACE